MVLGNFRTFSCNGKLLSHPLIPLIPSPTSTYSSPCNHPEPEMKVWVENLLRRKQENQTDALPKRSSLSKKLVGSGNRGTESFRWSTHLAAEWGALCVCMPFKSSRKDKGEAPFQSKEWKNRFCRKCKRPHLFWGLGHHSSLSFLQPELTPPSLQLLPLHL